MLLSFCISCYLLLAPSLGYPYFQDQIPNGNIVPHPCKHNYRWPGVGHKNSKGGGERNKFGLDFQAGGYKWTPELCRKDSDGDGTSNGEELGDPNCEWSQGLFPSRKVNITHPGVCDPFNSIECEGKNDFVTCSLDAFERCDVIKQPNVTHVDMKFNETQIPASETTYFCMTYDLPSDQDYHIVASEPIINNSYILHHMVLYACFDGDNYNLSKPTPCGMSATHCPILISGWTVGLSGQCFGNKAGYRIGLNGYKRVRLQIHYSNPQRLATYTDASGLRLYIRPALPEVQDMATFITGQTILTIPPGQRRVEQFGVCTSECTRKLLNKPLNVMIGNNHMHYLGFAMKVELFRAGVKLVDFTNEDAYSYDSPVMRIHDPPIQVLPGDEIRTTCVYNSMSVDNYVIYGEATSDEMCFGILYTYPKDAFNYYSACDAAGPLSPCDIRSGNPVAGCDWRAFIDLSNQNTSIIAEQLTKKCSLTGFCRPECKKYLTTLKDHPCLSGEVSEYIQREMQNSYEGVKFLGLLNSCPLDNKCPVEDDDESKRGDDATKLTPLFAALMLSLAGYIMLM